MELIINVYRCQIWVSFHQLVALDRRSTRGTCHIIYSYSSTDGYTIACVYASVRNVEQTVALRVVWSEFYRNLTKISCTCYANLRCKGFRRYDSVFALHMQGQVTNKQAQRIVSLCLHHAAFRGLRTLIAMLMNWCHIWYYGVPMIIPCCLFDVVAHALRLRVIKPALITLSSNVSAIYHPRWLSNKYCRYSFWCQFTWTLSSRRDNLGGDYWFGLSEIA